MRERIIILYLEISIKKKLLKCLKPKANSITLFLF